MAREWRRIATVVWLAAVSVACGKGSVNEANLAYLAGGDRMREHKPEEAIAEYDRAIQLAPNNADYHVARGIANNELEQFGAALGDFSHATRIDPKNPAALRHRGETYLLQAKFDDSLADCQRAIAASPDYQPAYTCEGTALLAMDEYDEAIKSFKKALALDATDDFAHWGLLRAEARFGATKEGGAEAAAGSVPASTVGTATSPSSTEAFEPAGGMGSPGPTSAGNPVPMLPPLSPAGDYLVKQVDRYLARRERAVGIALLNRVIRLMEHAPHIAVDLGLLLIHRGQIREEDKDVKGACSDYKKACVVGICDELTQKRVCRK